MKQRSLFILFVMLFLSGVAIGQTQTVTGKDLEKFREKRLNAERDYRENYARLGMPSPEELERRRVEDKKVLIDLSEKLRRQHYERVVREAEIAWRAYESAQRQPIYNPQILPGYSNPYYVPYYNYARRPYKRRHGRDISWRAGGGGVVYEPGGLSSYVWSAPPRARTQRPRRP
jgi:hypothetical protein